LSRASPNPSDPSNPDDPTDPNNPDDPGQGNDPNNPSDPSDPSDQGCQSPDSGGGDTSFDGVGGADARLGMFRLGAFGLRANRFRPYGDPPQGGSSSSPSSNGQNSCSNGSGQQQQEIDTTVVGEAPPVMGTCEGAQANLSVLNGTIALTGASAGGAWLSGNPVAASTLGAVTGVLKGVQYVGQAAYNAGCGGS
jgi:hypothetical protein